MKRRSLLLGGLATSTSAMLMSGCAGPTVNDYASQQPALNLPAYFNGIVDAWGIFTDRSGKVVKRFTVVMHCAWVNGVGTLDEDFVYSDGTKEKRIWTLTDLGEGRFEGTAGDVIGKATGSVKGNAFHWQYTLALAIDGRTLHVQMDDWMYLMNDRVMLNKARMSKLGIDLGEVTLAFTRRT